MEDMAQRYSNKLLDKFPKGRTKSLNWGMQIECFWYKVIVFQKCNEAFVLASFLYKAWIFKEVEKSQGIRANCSKVTSEEGSLVIS